MSSLEIVDQKKKGHSHTLDVVHFYSIKAFSFIARLGDYAHTTEEYSTYTVYSVHTVVVVGPLNLP